MKGKWRDKEFEIYRVGTTDGYLYDLSEVELLDNLDYWEKLKHQYAGMAMQGIMSRHNVEWDVVVNWSVELATALVQKLKEEK